MLCVDPCDLVGGWVLINLLPDLSIVSFFSRAVWCVHVRRRGFCIYMSGLLDHYKGIVDAQHVCLLYMCNYVYDSMMSSVPPSCIGCMHPVVSFNFLNECCELQSEIVVPPPFPSLSFSLFLVSLRNKKKTLL